MLRVSHLGYVFLADGVAENTGGLVKESTGKIGSDMQNDAQVGERNV